VLGLPEDVPEAPEAAPLVTSPEAVPAAAPAETPEVATTPLVVPPLVAPLTLAPEVDCVPELAAADPEPLVPEPPPWMGELELPQLSAVSANRAPRASTRARALVSKRVMQASGFPAGDFALLTSLMQGESPPRAPSPSRRYAPYVIEIIHEPHVSKAVRPGDGTRRPEAV
jgi:hypothetical protein